MKRQTRRPNGRRAVMLSLGLLSATWRGAAAAIRERPDDVHAKARVIGIVRRHEEAEVRLNDEVGRDPEARTEAETEVCIGSRDAARAGARVAERHRAEGKERDVRAHRKRGPERHATGERLGADVRSTDVGAEAEVQRSNWAELPLLLAIERHRVADLAAETERAAEWRFIVDQAERRPAEQSLAVASVYASAQLCGVIREPGACAEVHRAAERKASLTGLPSSRRRQQRDAGGCPGENSVQHVAS